MCRGERCVLEPVLQGDRNVNTKSKPEASVRETKETNFSCSFIFLGFLVSFLSLLMVYFSGLCLNHSRRWTEKPRGFVPGNPRELRHAGSEWQNGGKSESVILSWEVSLIPLFLRVRARTPPGHVKCLRYSEHKFQRVASKLIFPS